MDEALAYTIERFRAHYQALGFATEVYLAVAARNVVKPLDFDQRVKAVVSFSEKAEAEALSAANKRVANILAKSEAAVSAEINQGLLQEAAEKALVAAIQSDGVQEALQSDDYAQTLNGLAKLKEPVDTFFDDVMVMADDEAVKNNRLAILQALRLAFLKVADISLLAK